MFKGSYTDTVLENDLLWTSKRFKFSDECQIRDLAEAYNPRIPPHHNLNPSRSEEDFFPYVVCMQSFEPLCGRRNSDSVRTQNDLFIKDSVFAYKYMNTFCLLLS